VLRTPVRAALAVIALVAAGILGIPAERASAYALSGCYLNDTSITVNNPGWGASYSSPTASAAGSWNSKSTPVTFTFIGSTSAQVRVTVASRGEEYWARVTGTCSGGVYTGQVRFYWNTDTTGSLTNTQRTRVAMHEFGHVQGLDHVTRSCSNTNWAVMVQGTSKWACGWGGSPPWTDDVNGVNAVY